MGRESIKLDACNTTYSGVKNLITTVRCTDEFPCKKVVRLAIKNLYRAPKNADSPQS